MAHITQITLTNWGPYKGRHSIELEDTVYGVVCRYNDDPTRSNWGGKSWFLQSLRYALTGTPPKECRVEDDYITRGEEVSSVEHQLSNGFRIKRERKRGSATQLSVWRSKGAKVAKQKRAQALIDDELLRMSQGELEAGAFTEQRDVARFVLAPPGDKTLIVEGWMKLSPLKAAEKHALDQMGKASRILEGLSEQWASSRPEEFVEDLSPMVDVAIAAHNTAKAVLAAAVDVEHQRHAASVARYSKVVEVGVRLAAEVAAADLPLIDDYQDELVDAQQLAEGAVEKAAALQMVAGEPFDGICPITCDTCPVSKGRVRQQQNKRQDELKRAVTIRDGFRVQAALAREELEGAEADVANYDTMVVSLEDLRAEAALLEPSVDYINEHGNPPDPSDVAQLSNDVVDTAATRSELERRLEAAVAATETLEDLAPQIDVAQSTVAVYRDAARIIASTRRSIALRALRIIEAGANAGLNEAGIDLRVEAQWERPAAKGLAVQCRDCGSPYPTSQKVKSCESCGAVRGPKIIEQLELVSTARSGAADDSVGLMFRLAAAAWLRHQRESEWGVVAIDEPFGQLDDSNRDALASHLHGLLRGQLDFEQGFIVAHDASIMEALPKRVVVHSDGTYASLEVE